MNDLYNAVKLNIVCLADLTSVEDARVISDESELCRVIFDGISIEIRQDQRDKSVISSLVFNNTTTQYREELFTHILMSMFRYVNFRKEKSNDIDRMVAVELFNISAIIREVRANNLSPRDLYYFHRGHCAGYTDSVSA
jgi:hypothetical protein